MLFYKKTTLVTNGCDACWKTLAVTQLKVNCMQWKDGTAYFASVSHVRSLFMESTSGVSVTSTLVLYLGPRL
jgi:hypothetical protein